MRRWSEAREDDWTAFCRALKRMGGILKRRKAPEGGYAPKRERRHPLIELVMGAKSVVSAIGEIQESDTEARGVLSWVSIRETDGGTNVRLNHKGTKERCHEALQAAVDAIRRAGRRVSYYDMIRHENQNGYLMLMRVPDAAPALGFAR